MSSIVVELPVVMRFELESPWSVCPVPLFQNLHDLFPYDYLSSWPVPNVQSNCALRVIIECAVFIACCTIPFSTLVLTEPELTQKLPYLVISWFFRVVQHRDFHNWIEFDNFVHASIPISYCTPISLHVGNLSHYPNYMSLLFHVHADN